MLSRVAESLYWMARYIERAEDITRLIYVNFNTLLDAPDLAEKHGWTGVLKATGDEKSYFQVYETPTTKAVIEFLLWHPANQNAVTACIMRARENARSIREQISSEMWEHLNRLYLQIREINRDNILNNPGDFFRLVRNGTQAFQGVALATMTHGEAYQFIHLGLNIERADKTARILEGQHAEFSTELLGSVRPALALISLLRSCSAFEPFRRTPGSNLTLESVTEYLLLNEEFPRSVFFTLSRARVAVDRISGPNVESRQDSPKRALGRLIADLQYLDTQELYSADSGSFFSNLIWKINTLGDDISRAYFNTRLVLPEDRPRNQPPQQQQQQQQQSGPHARPSAVDRAAASSTWSHHANACPHCF